MTEPLNGSVYTAPKEVAATRRAGSRGLGCRVPWKIAKIPASRSRPFLDPSIRFAHR